VIDELVALSRELGDPNSHYAILAEGNTSALVDQQLMLVKASGTSLRDASHESFSAVRIDAMLALLDDAPDDEAEQAAALATCVVGDGPLRQSIEAPLHAVALRYAGARFVGHTHPTAVNAILCSEHAADLTRPLFPDQVVVCGAQPVFLPYADPGLPLARELRDALRERGQAPPKTLYLQNHGLVALGRSAAEVLAITHMAVKAASILGGALAAGGAIFLSEEQVIAIDRRLDEQHRRAALAEAGLRRARRGSGKSSEPSGS
jgi:rhamnose utilization protein RhaD (predicted bifunctional aldolase and dehydrogenase)